MLLQTEQDALEWYEQQDRVVTPEFIAGIPWERIKDHPLDERFIPILIYMRDVERFTEIYTKELYRTPTMQDPAIKAFVDRWSTEEPVHAELLDRFLNAAGYPTSDKWYEEAKARIPRSYRVTNFFTPLLTNGFGSHFSAVHMAWGAINEYSTLNGYQRLWETAKHPVLEQLLRGIAREEAAHSFFYWSVARIKLERSSFSQSLARFFIRNFWSPVGQGTKPKHEANLVIKTLFDGQAGVDFMQQRVNQQLQRLPGLSSLTTVTDRIAAISLA